LTALLPGPTLVAKVRYRPILGGRVRYYRLFLARIEAALAALTGGLGILTIVWHDWIEGLTGWNPDHHSGSFEAGLILVLLAASITCAALARRTYRRLAALTS
jgi:hypothetical protein